MTTEELCRLLNELRGLPKETEWVEFKVNDSEPFGIGRSLSALANGARLHDQSFGYLVFGIRDNDHAPIGTTFRPKLEKKGNEELENWLLQSLNPRPNLDLFEFESGGQTIVLIRITAAIDRPIGFQMAKEGWTAFVRVGSYTKKLRDYPEKERMIWRNHEGCSFEKETAKDGLVVEDVLKLLDYTKFFHLAELPLPTSGEGVLERLEQEGFIVKRLGTFAITNLGAILFAQDLRQFPTVDRKALRIVFYRGGGRNEADIERENHKGYAVDFDDAVDFIYDRIPSREEVPNALRVELRMFPKIAIRELLANALVHQDFEIRGDGPMVEVFNDRMEIYNPGTPLIKVDRFIDGKRSRNECLAVKMRTAHICEERGQGVDKALIAIELLGLPAPKFAEDDNIRSTKVTVYAAKTLDRLEKPDRVRACYQHCCLNHVRGKSTTNETVRARFNLPTTRADAATRIINDTIEIGLIRASSALNKSRKYASYVPFWA